MTPQPRKYFQYVLWPVLDDDGQLDYWDIHHPEDEDGESDPLAEGFGTLTDAKKWVKARHRDDLFLRALGDPLRWRTNR